MAADSLVVTPAARTALIRERQRELYGAPLRTVVYRLLADYGISQARLARIIGLSPAALSLLVSARRVKISNPLVHTKLMVLDQRRPKARAQLADRGTIETILTTVARIGRPWPHHTGRHDDGGAPTGLRYADSEELEAAAARIRDEFPAIADMLRRAADHGTA
ncbi:XRE family transcriptional regulator [Pseudonocardia adelaidensis]